MTKIKSIYEELEENYFDLGELRDLSNSVGIESITDKALSTLGKFITDYGRIITQLALFQSNNNVDETIDINDLKIALEKIPTYQPPNVFYIWIIAGNGSCLYSKSLSNIEFPDTIFSGMLIGIHILAKELTGRSFERIDMEDLSLYLTESSNLICAILSKSDNDAGLLNKTILLEFLGVFRDVMFESALDVNIFQSFDKISRAIIRDWQFIKPEITAEMRKVLVEADSIEIELSSDYKKEDLESAMNEIRNFEIFQETKTQSTEELDKILEKKFQFSENDKKRFRIDIKELMDQTDEPDSEI
ncbi:MAG: hypothetical protein ACW967_03305 [Candidatus Hodarchaeales archaeon]|jgi:hypothetical protein